MALRGFTKRYLILVAACGVLSACGTPGPNESPPEYPEFELRNFGMLCAVCVASPLGKFIYVRRGNEGCVVKFGAYDRKHDGTAPSVFTSGEETTSAQYEALYQGDGSFDFSKANVVRIKDKVGNRASIGFGHYADKPGTKLGVLCGPLDIHWYFPHFLSFSTFSRGGYRQDDSLELAMTAIEDERRIEFNRAHLTWYRVGQGRERGKVLIPLIDLAR